MKIILLLFLLGCTKTVVIEHPVPAEIRAQNVCNFNNREGSILFFLIVPVHYTRPVETTELHLWDIRCGIENTCEGVFLNLTNIVSDRVINLLDISQVQGAEIISRVGSVVSIKWGPHRTFEFDAEQKTVRYIESSKKAEGRGKSLCDEVTGYIPPR